MSSRIAQAADAVVALIGTQSGYTVERGWAVQRKLEDFAKTGWIFVMPATRGWPGRMSRATPERTFEISIGIQRRHNGKAGELAPKDAVDAIDAVAEAIGEMLMDRLSKVVGIGFTATCQSVDAPTIVADEHLAQLRLVTSVMTVKYKVDP